MGADARTRVQMAKETGWTAADYAALVAVTQLLWRQLLQAHHGELGNETGRGKDKARVPLALGRPVCRADRVGERGPLQAKATVAAAVECVLQAHRLVWAQWPRERVRFVWHLHSAASPSDVAPPPDTLHAASTAAQAAVVAHAREAQLLAAVFLTDRPAATRAATHVLAVWTYLYGLLPAGTGTPGAREQLWAWLAQVRACGRACALDRVAHTDGGKGAGCADGGGAQCGRCGTGQGHPDSPICPPQPSHGPYPGPCAPSDWRGRPFRAHLSPCCSLYSGRA
jgi:hypothetical protein